MPVAQHPLGPPTVSGNDITVDVMMEEPTRVTRFLSDITLQDFILEDLFVSAGGVSGGAVIYDQPTVNELYPERDVQQVEVGAEFPVLTSDRRAPLVALVEKWGGKVWIPDEAVRRNQSMVYQRELRKMANAMVRKLNTRAIQIIEAAITAGSGLHDMTGHDWDAIILDGNSPTVPTSRASADFITAQMERNQQELGIVFDRLIMNPAQEAALMIAYGEKYPTLLQAHGLTPRVSNRVAAGTAYLVASGQLGEMRVEKPLSTETWRERKTQRNWTQTDWVGVFYVANPYAVMKLTGL
jgi:hypothetical protein